MTPVCTIAAFLLTGFFTAGPWAWWINLSAHTDNQPSRQFRKWFPVLFAGIGFLQIVQFGLLQLGDYVFYIPVPGSFYLFPANLALLSYILEARSQHRSNLIGMAVGIVTACDLLLFLVISMLDVSGWAPLMGLEFLCKEGYDEIIVGGAVLYAIDAIILYYLAKITMRSMSNRFLAIALPLCLVLTFDSIGFAAICSWSESFESYWQSALAQSIVKVVAGLGYSLLIYVSCIALVKSDRWKLSSLSEYEPTLLAPKTSPTDNHAISKGLRRVAKVVMSGFCWMCMLLGIHRAHHSNRTNKAENSLLRSSKHDTDSLNTCELTTNKLSACSIAEAERQTMTDLNDERLTDEGYQAFLKELENAPAMDDHKANELFSIEQETLAADTTLQGKWVAYTSQGRVKIDAESDREVLYSRCLDKGLNARNLQLFQIRSMPSRRTNVGRSL